MNRNTQVDSYVQRLIPWDTWVEIQDGDVDAAAMYCRYYSARRRWPAYSRLWLHIAGPGEYLLLTTPSRDAICGFKRFHDLRAEPGIYLWVFRAEQRRSESRQKASHLLREAIPWAWERWPQEVRIYTYVNPRHVRSGLPGYCFLRAGFKHAG